MTRVPVQGYRDVFDVSDEQAREHQGAIDRYAEQLREREREAWRVARQYLIGNKRVPVADSKQDVRDHDDES